MVELDGSLSRAHELCRQLSEELSILRLVGELGNKFFESSDAFYAWRPDAFHLEDVQNQFNEVDAAFLSPSTVERDERSVKSPLALRDPKVPSPMLSPTLHSRSPPLLPQKEEKEPLSPTLGRSGLTRNHTISAYLSSAFEMAANNVSSMNAKIVKAGGGVGGDKLQRLQKEANEAEEAYRIAVKELDELR